ncbi:MAG: hypothetical protein L3J84_07285 [Gammaproteobacteria bacterium]|nr:hypothetical protein [Gammaproteobacteria bacterium]
MKDEAHAPMLFHKPAKYTKRDLFYVKNTNAQGVLEKEWYKRARNL